MLMALHDISSSLMHLFFPHVCRGCYQELQQKDHFLCTGCLSVLPYSGFEKIQGNPVEKIFFGRIHIEAAASFLFFTPASVVQHLIHQVKYRNQQQLAVYLGRAMGQQLAESERFGEVDLVVPLPLFRNREAERGYNQAGLLARGVAGAMGLPVEENALTRVRASATQTRKNRAERWENVEGLFQITGKPALDGKNILLVDDVVTTGATLEACATAIRGTPGARVWISTLAYAMQ